MAKKIAAAAAAVVEKVKRFQMHARLLGGDGATVRVNLRESKTGGRFNLSTTLREVAIAGQPKPKAQTGAVSSATTKEEAVKAFDDLVAVAIAHGWMKPVKKVRVPKAPAFTIETFPTAKPFVAGAEQPGALKFPKAGTKTTTKSTKK